MLSEIEIPTFETQDLDLESIDPVGNQDITSNEFREELKSLYQRHREQSEVTQEPGNALDFRKYYTKLSVYEPESRPSYDRRELEKQGIILEDLTIINDTHNIGDFIGFSRDEDLLSILLYKGPINENEIVTAEDQHSLDTLVEAGFAKNSNNVYSITKTGKEAYLDLIERATQLTEQANRCTHKSYANLANKIY